jgi:hypothetical protein
LPNKEVRETIVAHGHENIQATHPTTFEITKESQMSKKGDCIIAVSADKSTPDFSPAFSNIMQRDNAKLTITIEAGDAVERIRALGSSKLILTHPSDVVVRKSYYTCSRTLAIRADKAARDLPRKFVEKLKNPKQKVKITLTATV